MIRLANGAFSIHSSEYGETFHPVIGPAAEAKALYVNQLNLRRRVLETAGEFVIWDVGLGAAANVLTVIKAIRDLPCKLRLVSFDQTTAPLAFALENTRHLEYLAESEEIARARLTCPDPVLTLSLGATEICWELHLGNFPDVLGARESLSLPAPHAILFDAYSPATNPEMWTLPLFQSLFRALDPGRACAMPTYSRSTMLRVTLLLAGFFVGKGHATGEKEETTIAANSLALISHALDLRWLKRARNSTSAEPLHDAVYRQAPLSEKSWEALRSHPQFA